MNRNQDIPKGDPNRRIPLILAVMLMIVMDSSFCFSEIKGFGDRLLEDRNAQWEILADHLSYSEGDGLYRAEGGVTISGNGTILSAQKAIYNERTGIVQVAGDVRLETNGDILTGEKGFFDLNNYYGQLTRGHIFLRENNVHIRGSSMTQLEQNTYVVTECRVTTCDGELPAWSISGSEVKVTLEGYGHVKHAAFRIKDFPVFYIPYAVFPVKTKRQSGLLLPKMGYSSRNGIDLEVPIYWAISNQTDATFYERYMSKRGLMQGLEYRYLTKDGSKGIFLFDVLKDRKDHKDLENPDEVDIGPLPRTNETRYWLRSRTDQTLPLEVSARLDTDYVSDQDYLKEFRGIGFGSPSRPDLEEESGRPVDDIYSPLRRSALRLSRDGETYSLQGLASYYQRPENPPEDETPQPLIGFHFARLTSPIAERPIFLGIRAKHDYIWRDQGEMGHSIALTPQTTYPIRIGRYLELEQSLALDLNAQWLNRHSAINDDQQTKCAYESKTRLSTVLERTFDFHWKDIKRVKHKFVPSLIYTYRGYRQDGDKYSPWFEPIDERGRINRITLSMENLLDARKENDKGDVSYLQWGTFSLAQSYNLHEGSGDEEPWREKEPFEPLMGVLTLKPFLGINLETEAHWDHYEKEITLMDNSLELGIPRSGGRTDTLYVNYKYEKEESNWLGFGVNLNLTEGFSVGTSIWRDFDKGDDVATRSYVDYASQCWAVRFITEKLDDSKSFMIIFRLSGLGDLGTR